MALTLLLCLLFCSDLQASRLSARPSLEADLEVSLRLSSATARVGDEVIITIEVYNQGPRTPEGVVAHYRLPDGLAFLAAAFSDASDTYDPATGAWQIGAIPRDMLMPVPTMRLEVTARVTAPGTTEHIAEVVQSSRPDPDSEPGNADPTEDDYAHASLTAERVEVFDLRLAKSDGGATAVPGERLTYRLDYTNDGLAATGVVLTETLPEHTTFDAAGSTLGWSLAGGNQYVLALGNLEAGTSGTVAFAVVVEATVAETVAEITNTATLSDDRSQGTDATPANNTSTVATPLTHPTEADLSLTLTASHEGPVVGSELTVMVQVANVGPAQATGVSVIVTLPQGLRLLAHDVAAAYDARSGLWTLGPMEAASQATLTLTVGIQTAGTLRIGASISTSDQADPDSVPGGGQANEDDEADLMVTGMLGEPRLTGPEEGSQVVTSSVDLRWEAVLGAMQYDVEVALAGSGFAERVFERELGETSVEVEGLAGSEYEWRVRAVSGEVVGAWSQVGSFTMEAQAVSSEKQAVPGDAYRLSEAYPNPFNPQTSFSLAVPVAQEISIEVYNLLGRRVVVLHQGMMQANQAQSFVWQASSQPSGLYFIRVIGERFTETRQVTLIK